MTRIKVETKDPWAFLRDRDVDTTFISSLPKTRATMAIPTSEGVRIGWSLFWRSLWWTIRRRKSIDFWMEGES